MLLKSKKCVFVPERIHHVQGELWLFPRQVAGSHDSGPHTPLPAPTVGKTNV